MLWVDEPATVRLQPTQFSFFVMALGFQTYVIMECSSTSLLLPFGGDNLSPNEIIDSPSRAAREI